MWSSSDEELDEMLRNRRIRRPRNFQPRRHFQIENPREFREKFRLPVEAVDHLLEVLAPQLEHRTRRNVALTPRQQLLTFLHFLGTNSFYHVMHSCHGIATSTVFNVVRRVVPAILSLRRHLIHWPDQPLRIAGKYREIAGFPSVAGCLDGTHIIVMAPSNDEEAYVNRHHSKSLNVAMVTGPDHTVYFCSSRCPGRWHDSRVLRESSLWTAFEDDGRRPFPGSVILGDSAYPCKDWLIPPFRGDVEGARLRFNEAHKQTRCTIERAFGVIKQRFYSLKTGLRVRSVQRAAELVQCAVILHNLCIRFNDHGNDFPIEHSAGNVGHAADCGHEEHMEGRRQQLLQHFV